MTENSRFGEVPDLQAAKKIPIQDVVDSLGLERQGRMIRCWRPEKHQNGDRTPSVGIELKRNRVKCFVCDARRLSPIDLVQSVLHLDTYAALLWMDTKFGLPRIPKGKHLSRHLHSGFGERIGVNGRLEPLIHAGLLADLTHAEVRLLQVFDAFCDPLTHRCKISYAGLKRFSGIAKDSTISNALKRLRNLHIIDVQRGFGGHGIPSCSTYTLTLEHSDFLRLLQTCCSATREEIGIERELRAARRRSLHSIGTSSDGFSQAGAKTETLPVQSVSF